MKITDIFDLLSIAGRALGNYQGSAREMVAAVDAQKHVKEARLILARFVATPYALPKSEAEKEE